MWSFPARFLAEFFDNHGMLGFRDRPRWRTIAGGAARYVEKLIAPLGPRLRLRAPVESVARAVDHVVVKPRGGEAERFDQIVIATHSDQALRLLSDATEREREVLGSFAYQDNEAVLHTDTRMLPRRRRAWASWNYHLQPDAVGRTTVTYHMNRLQSLRADREFCVTLNRTAEIDPEAVLRTMSYAHPVYTPGAVAAQRRHGEVSGHPQRTHFCGAYWGWGFHEDGVRSGLRVAAQFGGGL
jgi:predicted NAD/FAD-binding protein